VKGTAETSTPTPAPVSRYVAVTVLGEPFVVDVDLWAAAYGTPATPRAVADDVRAAMRAAVGELLAPFRPLPEDVRP
jgi:hypothetical protein